MLFDTMCCWMKGWSKLEHLSLFQYLHWLSSSDCIWGIISSATVMYELPVVPAFESSVYIHQLELSICSGFPFAFMCYSGLHSFQWTLLLYYNNIQKIYFVSNLKQTMANLCKWENWESQIFTSTVSLLTLGYA